MSGHFVGDDNIDWDRNWTEVQPPESIPTYTDLSAIQDVRDLLPRQSFSVLELGCGPAAWCSFWELAGASYTGVDASPAAIETARRRCPGRLFILGRAEEVELREEQYDVVFTSTFMQHTNWETKRKLAPKIRAWLRPGGILLMREKTDPPDSSAISVSEWEDLLRPLGLVLVRRGSLNLAFKKV